MSDAAMIAVAGLMLAAGIGAALLADRVKVPALLLFLGLGMLVGSDGLGGVEFDDAELARTLGTIALVLILFEGGMTAGWREIRPVLGTAISLATVATVLTAVLTGFAAVWLFDLTTLEGMIVGAAVAATDSAAIFAVLRGSRLERRLARSLEGESGLNDPVALLLVTGFIEWIDDPGYGAPEMVAMFGAKMAIGVAAGLAIGWLARAAFRALVLPTEGIYPVLSIATAAIAYGLAETAHGSGLLSVYLAALVVGTGQVPGRTTAVAFHSGISWVAQISLFFMLGLLVFPSQLVDIAGDGVLLAAFLIVIARPAATLLATALSGLNVRERLMLSWAGLRGATPIWLATFPVVAGVTAGEELFNIVFFVVVGSTLVQGTTFEPLAQRLGVTTTEPALPQRLFESGRIRRLGGDVIEHRLRRDAAAVGNPVRELELPREALVNVIVRDGQAIAPRGSTELMGGDELHILVSRDRRDQVEMLFQRWQEGPIGQPPPELMPKRAASQVFSVRPARELVDDPADPGQVGGIKIAIRLRSRSDEPGVLVQLADGRYAITGPNHVAVGPRRTLADWAARRAARPAAGAVERAWWQEVVGVLATQSPRRRRRPR